MAKRDLIDNFVSRLKASERSKDPHELAALFSSDAELAQLTHQHTHPGRPQSRSSKSASAARSVARASALSFWSQYLHAFDVIETEFTEVLDNGQTAVLQWISRGTLPNGLPIEYNGISVLHYNEDQIDSLRTYFDTAAFLPHTSRTEKTASEAVGSPDITIQATS